jgi:NADH:ubiquinone oxidoreductase subunit H
MARTKNNFPFVSNYLIYYFSPVLGFFLSLLVWVLIPYLSCFISFELGLLFFWLVLNLVFILL